MKKLMIMALALGVGCSLNAASFTWGFQSNETVAPDGQYFGDGSYNNASVFLFLGSSEIKDGKFNISKLTQVAYVSAMDIDSLNWGAFSTDSMPASDLVKADSSLVGQAYTLVLVAKAGLTELAEGTEYEMIVAGGTSQISRIAGMGTMTYYADFTNDTAYTSWSSATVSVPEPTSGLLLLGVAGLALKRKQA